jgi:hypothetical protein
MGKLIFELSDEERDALERTGSTLGLRSHAETLRALIQGSRRGAACHDGNRRDPAFDRPSAAEGIGVARRRSRVRPQAVQPPAEDRKGEAMTDALKVMVEAMWREVERQKAEDAAPPWGEGGHIKGIEASRKFAPGQTDDGEITERLHDGPVRPGEGRAGRAGGDPGYR